MAYAVLLVEDEPGLRRALAWALTDEGYLVHEAGDGLAALVILDSSPVDLITTDLTMPILDGHGFLRELDRRRITTPVIVMSATSLGDLDGNTAATLRKPFDLDLFLLTVDNALAGNLSR
jgi:DNA-binding response OmpR family regulator